MAVEKMSQEEINAFDNLAESFAEKEVRPMLDVESTDGDLKMLPKILEKGNSVGLLTSLNSEDAGYELGIWGSGTYAYGPQVTLKMLRHLAKICGGVAMCFST